MKNTSIRILASVFCASLLFAVCGTARAATYAKKLDITAAGVPENVTLTDFPLLVRLSTNITDFAYTDFVSNDGTDLHFEDANGNALAYDIDTWNTSGESLVWVKVPSLQKDDVITAKFGSVAPDANDATNVWSNYVFVWHGNGDGTGQDATGRTRTMTPQSNGFAISADETAFLGSSYLNTQSGNTAKKISVTSNPFSDLTSIGTYAVSLWIKPAQAEPNIRLISTKKSHTNNGMELMAIKNSGMLLRGNGNSKTVAWPGTNTDYGYQALKKQSWAHVAGVANGTSGKIFTNGQSFSGVIDATTTAAEGFSICGMGGDGTYDQPSMGYVDEVRLYNGNPDDAYLAAEWAQVASNNYVVCGAVQATSSDAATITDAPGVVRNGDGTYTVSAVFTGTVGSTYDVEFQLNGAAADTQSVTLETTETNLSWTTAANLADGTYLPRVQVSIGTSTALRAADTAFLAGDLAFGVCTNAYEEGLVPGAFVLTRPGDAAQPLTVAYSVASPTAVAGTSYAAFPGTATFAAGEASVAIPVVPLNDAALMADATLTLTLSAGLYGIAQGAGSVSVTLVNFAPPEGYNVWIAPSGSDGLASTGSNWSAGRAPTATDKILLGAWSVMDLTWDAAATNTVAAWEQRVEYTGTVTFPITYEGVAGDEGFNLFAVTGNVALNGGSWVHPIQGNSSKTATEPVEKYRLTIAVGGNMSIASGVDVSAEGRGRGFWIYDTNSKGWRGRAAHAGYVITTTNDMFSAESDPLFMPYGSILAPVATGKGTTSQGDPAVDLGHGGGAIRLAIAGQLSHAGRIIANGQKDTGATGGAGGSIWVSASTIYGAGTFEANGTTANGSGAHAASSGGRVSIVTTGFNSASAATATAHGSRAPDQYQVSNDPYWQGAAGTVWLQSSSDKTLLVRNSCTFNSVECAPYIRAYTPIPADDDPAAFSQEIKDATLYINSNGRVRLEGNLKFRTLKVVRTPTASIARLDLHGKTLRVESIVDSDGNVIADRGIFNAANPPTGWTGLEDAVGSGKLIVGDSSIGTVIMMR